MFQKPEYGLLIVTPIDYKGPADLCHISGTKIPSGLGSAFFLLFFDPLVPELFYLLSRHVMGILMRPISWTDSIFLSELKV